MQYTTTQNQEYAGLLSNLHTRYRKEWLEESAVNPGLIALNVQQIEDKEAIAKLLNWKCYLGSPGWYIKSVDVLTGSSRNAGQFKPDEPYDFGERTQKYLTFPKGSQVEPIFLKVDLTIWHFVCERYCIPFPHEAVNPERLDFGFWDWVTKTKHIPIFITEGVKKAACLLSHGYVAVALPGIWNAIKKAKAGYAKSSDLKHELHDLLKPFGGASRHVYLAFDADTATAAKENVEQALVATGNVFRKHKCKVSLVQWDAALGKGCDDLISREGIMTWENLVENSKDFKRWVDSLENNLKQTNKGDKRPFSTEVAEVLAEKYRATITFNSKRNCFYAYGDGTNSRFPAGIWTELDELEIRNLVHSYMRSEAETGNWYSASYVDSTIKTLRDFLFSPDWNEAEGLLPFVNGVLDIKAKRFMPHAPGYRFTWRIERRFNPLSAEKECLNILDFLYTSVKNDQSLVRYLLCLCNAILRSRYDLQIFTNLIGAGGSGKSSYIRLLAMLVSERNVYSTNLPAICKKDTAVAGAYGKKLIIMPDQKKYVGDVGALLQLTGGDLVEAKRLYEDPFNFVFKGMVVISSNTPVFLSDNSSAIWRRCRTIPFTHVVPKSERKVLEPIFASELDAFTMLVLNIPDEEVSQVLLNYGTEESPGITKANLSQLLETSSVADWVNERVVRRQGAKLYIGVQGKPDTAYGDYLKFCEVTRRQAKSLPAFSNELGELFSYILPGWEDVTRNKRDKKGNSFSNIALRHEHLDDDPLSILDDTATSPTDDDSDVGSVYTDVGLGVGSEPLHSKGGVGYVGFSSKSNATENQSSSGQNKKNVVNRNFSAPNPTPLHQPYAASVSTDTPTYTDVGSKPTPAKAMARWDAEREGRKDLLQLLDEVVWCKCEDGVLRKIKSIRLLYPDIQEANVIFKSASMGSCGYCVKFDALLNANKQPIWGQQVMRL